MTTCLSYFCWYLPLLYYALISFLLCKNGKRKVQGVPQSQTAAPSPPPRPPPPTPTKTPRRRGNRQIQTSTNRTNVRKAQRSALPKRGNRNTKRTEKHKKRTKWNTERHNNKLPHRINHKATKSKTNTGTTAPERPVEPTTGRSKALPQPANFTLGPDATLNTETHKNSVRIKAHNSVNASKRNTKIKLITIINKDEYSWLILLYARVNENQ